MTMSRRLFLHSLAAAGVGIDAPRAAAAEEQRFPASDVRHDLDTLWTTLRDVGAEPFRTSQRSVVDALYRRIRGSIDRPLTARAAWLTIAPMLGALNDGHVDVRLPAAFARARKRFPLRFAYSGSRLVVIEDRSRTLQLGSEIVSIDGVSAEQYLAVCAATLGAPTAALRHAWISYRGTTAAVALFGAGPVYRVRSIKNGVVQERDVTASSATVTPEPPPYSYTLIPDAVGYIDYRRCEDLPRFKRFLTTTFGKIREQRIGALVIDIRRNGGGSSELNDALWPYVSAKPFRQFGSFIIKACDRIKAAYGREDYVEAYGSNAWAAPDGTILRVAQPLVVPGKNDLRYTGRTYLLTSSVTFSSAMSCALAAKDYGLATLIGEETGELQTSTGQVFTIETPRLGFWADLATSVFVAPKPQAASSGVVPDVRVTTTVSDIVAGRDPVLERVFTLLSGQ